MDASGDLYICWEFNTWDGCEKGNDCQWSHRFLVEEKLHPYTGEKLVGIVERYKNDPSCMKDAKLFHDNGARGGKWWDKKADE